MPSLETRAAGLLLHLTSLPSRHGVGDLGSEARRFAESLRVAGISWWQMLPVGPIGVANSPYQSSSTFAGSSLFLSLDRLAEEGWLGRADVGSLGVDSTSRVDYGPAREFKESRLAKAAASFHVRAGRSERKAFERFRTENRAWLDDYALFRALRRAHRGASWTEWPPEVRRREPGALADAREHLADELHREEFVQYQFDRQWSDLHSRCAKLGVGLLGDLPIFVAHDSAEVWARPDLFELDERGNPAAVAGVPPDYFSESGQRWGNPLYRWDRHAAEGYRWWIGRFRAAFARFDAVRLDHFIGFHRYWRIPADRETAVQGRWVPGPGAALFDAVSAELGRAPIVAEDLGAVTPEVTALRERYGFPGMRVLQFGFAGDGDFHSPKSYPSRCVAYTGTHDTDTAVGWFRGASAEARVRQRALETLGSDGSEIHWDFLRAVWRSRADLAFAPVQDVLGLGSEARMNRPGTIEGNWQWRLRPRELGEPMLERLSRLTADSSRSARP